MIWIKTQSDVKAYTQPGVGIFGKSINEIYSVGHSMLIELGQPGFKTLLIKGSVYVFEYVCMHRLKPDLD
jgi:hypothetical protein